MYEVFYIKQYGPGNEYGSLLKKGGYDLWHYELSHNTFHALHQVELLPTGSALVDDLMEYTKNIAPQQLIDLQQPPRVIRGLLESHLDGFKQEDLQAMLLDFFSEIDQTLPTYLNEIKDVKLAQALFHGNITGGKYNAIVKTLNPNSSLYRMLVGSSTGKYFQRLNLIVLPEDLPRPKELWKQLASSGSLPSIFDKANSLLTLDTQITPQLRSKLLGVTGIETLLKQGINYEMGKLTMKIIEAVSDNMIQRGRNRLNVDPILSYVHAQEAVGVSPTTAQGDYVEGDTTLLQTLEDLRLHSNYTSQIKSAYEAIHYSRLLGMDDTQIGKIVSQSRYQENQYTVFNAIHRDLLPQWGIESDDEEGKKHLFEALDAKKKLEWYWSRNKVQKLALTSLNLS